MNRRSPASGADADADTDADVAPVARRQPWPTAILGDGRLLATFSARGELEQCCWPHLDIDPNLAEARLGLRVDGTHHWLDESWAIRQRYRVDTDVLETTLSVEHLDDPVVITDVVASDAPVLVRQVQGAGRLGVFVRPQLTGRLQAGGAYVDPPSGVLVFHRRDQVMAVAMDVSTTAGVGRRQDGDASELDLAQDLLPGAGIVHGEVDGALLATTVHATTTVAIAFAHEHATAVERATSALVRGAGAPIAERRRVDAATLQRPSPPLVDGDAARVERRSQLVFSALTDRATGGIIAGPEQSDRAFERSGGYGFVWPRDAAFVLLAYLACGRDDLAVPGLRWLARAQGRDGLWLQRHWTDGTLAPSWGIQLDETGAVIVAYERAWRTLGDRSLDDELWPSAAAGADALVRMLDPATGLPAPSLELWETRMGMHAYTAASTCAGLRAAASMAARHAPERAAAWVAASQRVRAGIDEHLWSPEHDRYLRSIEVARGDDTGTPPSAAYELIAAHPSAPVVSVDPVDATVDVSLLGLVYPFGVMTADEPRMAATIEAVTSALTSADDGLRRYVGDDYIGGNPWVLARLWLGLARRPVGAAVPADGIEYARRVCTPTHLLPEQVDEVTGEPRWVVPLTWSHAMYVLACHADPSPR